MKKIFRKVIIIVICFCLIITYQKSEFALAGNDTASAAYGFIVDSGSYKTSVWYNQISTNIKINGYIVGVQTANIGMTRSKNTGKTYYDQVMIKATMKGKQPKTTYTGYAEHLTIESSLPSGTTLVNYSPESEASMKSYTVGLNANNNSVGLTASTTVTQKALVINNYCDTSSKLFKICYDYQHAKLAVNAKSINTYSYNESVQRAHYTLRTTQSKYKIKITFKAKFQRYIGAPSYWAQMTNDYCTVNKTVSLTSPY